MKTKSATGWLLLVLILNGGCSTLVGPSAEEVRREEDQKILDEKIGKLQGMIQTLRLENQTLAQQMEQLQTRMRESEGGWRTRVDELEKQVQALQSARAQDRAAVVEELSRKMAAMMQNQTAARSAAAGSASAYGYEHVVKTGQTLSEIAQAYGVSVSAIKKANNLKSDMVRSGQKLFIPER